MTDRISGSDLRAKLLRRFSEPASEAGEAERIEALAPASNRQLLVVIGQARPRSVGELAKLVARHQPNVSRGLSALSRAGLVRLVADGRTSVPTLTDEGIRKAAELSGEVDYTTATEPVNLSEQVATILCVEFSAPDAGDLKTDELLGALRLQFGRKFSSDQLDLNELGLRVLRNWWPMLYRRDDPFPLCTMRLDAEAGAARRGAFLIRSLGAQVEMAVRGIEDVEAQSSLLTFSCSSASAVDMLMERLLEPLATRLEHGRRFDRPLHALFERLKDTLEYKSETDFAKTAGALGMSPYGLSDGAAASIHWLMSEMPEEDTRLDFASATLPETFERELKWSREQLRACRRTNALDGLLELKRGRPRGEKSWLRGKNAARALRRDLKLAPDASVGGIDGLLRLFCAKRFEFSDAPADTLLGYRGCVSSKPVAVLKDTGPRGNAFLLARTVGDLLTHDDEEAPVTEVHSIRQAVGRAFAAEFLAPSDAVVHMIESDKRPKLAVATHFGVDLAVIAHQYGNNA